LAIDVRTGAAFFTTPPAFFPAFFPAVFFADFADFRDVGGFAGRAADALVAPARRFAAGRDVALALGLPPRRAGAFDFLRAGAAFLAPRLPGFDAGLAARLALEVRRRACFLAMPV
jgi:hypothetical protein